MPSRKSLDLRTGDLITVRSKEEIFATLDRKGELDALPFMPEMLQYCGGQFRVYKRADKTCDTIDNLGSRRMHDTVHVGALRCDGSAHGGCEAGCLLFFKEDWLRRAEPSTTAGSSRSPMDGVGASTEIDLRRACTENGAAVPGTTVIYRCQATRLKAASEPLRWWDPRQHVRDLRTRNAGPGQMLRGFAYAAYRSFMGMGRGYRVKVALFDRLQSLWGGIPFPWHVGTAEKTPREDLALQTGDWVRVKPYTSILATIDQNNKNRGLWFDAEMVKYCGRTFRVESKVHRIIHEKNGHMIEFKNPPVILENVFCCGELTTWRLFCPRAIPIYWRDVWLERVSGPDPNQAPMACTKLMRELVDEQRRQAGLV